MADQIFMYMTTAGTLIAFGVLLFVSKGIRKRSSPGLATSSSSFAPPSSSYDSKSSSSSNIGRKVKKYSSDGKPIYED